MEPEEVIYANYDNEGYEGRAFVAFRNGDKYFTVNASHCSCYGLEGQWNENIVEYSSKEEFINNMRHYATKSYYGSDHAHVLENMGVDLLS